MNLIDAIKTGRPFRRPGFYAWIPIPRSIAGVIDEISLVDLLAEFAPDEQTRKKILADNPSVLYGFETRENPT